MADDETGVSGVSENEEAGKEIRLDSKTQKALAYLSGIPVTTGKELVDTVPNVSDKEHNEFQRLVDIWLRLQREEMKEIGRTLLQVLQGLDLSKKKVRERLESFEYLKLIRKSFRSWSTVESDEKREMIRNMLINASVKTSSPDYVLSMFIDWLDEYTDSHFEVIKRIFLSEPVGLTRKEIWIQLKDHVPPEDSAEADLFRLLMLDLTTGHVVRQPREKNFYGNFVRTKPKRSAGSDVSAQQQISAFDDEKKYVLTELGKQFVSYTMKEDEEEDE